MQRRWRLTRRPTRTRVAHSCISEKQTDLAIADLNEAIKLKPDYTAALTNRGNAYAAQGEYDLAIADFNTELKYKPTDTVAIANRAAVYAKMGKPEPRGGRPRGSVKGQSRQSRALSRARQSYMSQKSFAEAIGQYDLALKLDPHDAISLLNRGACYHSLGKFEKAIADYTEALKYAPNNARLYNNRGSAYGAIRKLDEAIADYEKALSIQPDFADARHNLEGATKAKETGKTIHG